MRISKAPRIRHNMCATPEYRAWCHMKERCNNPTCKNYKHYGARGIKVCKRWDSFINFYNDMGARPSDKHSLDRIDNDSDYTPDNCRWTTRTVQNLNRRMNSNNKSGYRGVCFDKKTGKYVAQITIDYQRIVLGYFTDPTEASKIYESRSSAR